VPTYPFARDRHWIAAPAGAAPGADSSLPCFFEEDWREQAAAVPEVPDGMRTIIIADEAFHVRIADSDALGRFSRAILVAPAAETRQVSDRMYQVCADDPAGLNHVLETIAAGCDEPIAIVHALAQGRAAAGIHGLFDFFKGIRGSAHHIAHVTLVGQYHPARADTSWDYSWIGFERSLKLSLPRTRVSVTFWLCLVSAIASVVLVYVFLRSRQGLALLAIRDSEVASESQGVNVRATKLGVYLVAAFGAGLAGALYFLGNLRISPDAAFTVNWTAFSIFIVMIGGIGTIEGPIIGVVLFYLLNKFFSDYGTWYLVGLGLLAIVVTIRFPRGIWGWVAHRYDLHLFPVQRRLVISPQPGFEKRSPPDQGNSGELQLQKLQ